MTIINDIYDKIGIILTDLQKNQNTPSNISTKEIYALYLERYPEDDKVLATLGESMTLKMYVPGMVWEYSRKSYGDDPNKPSIEFLGKGTYRFKSKSFNQTILSKKTALIIQGSSGDYLPSKDDFVSAYRMICPSRKAIHIDAVLDQIEKIAIESGYSLKHNWRTITEKNIQYWVKD
jgi:hypothetical protein